VGDLTINSDDMMKEYNTMEEGAAQQTTIKMEDFTGMKKYSTSSYTSNTSHQNPHSLPFKY
jgi:hypothetical protein